jgi:hypothetical protein
MTAASIREFYTQQSAQTSPGHRSALFKSLPDKVMDLCEIVQGLFIYDVVAKDFYGFEPPKARLEEIHTRSVAAMLERIRDLDDSPLDVARPPEKRMLSRCDGFVMTLTSMLRSKGVPARARCGFGAYFNPPRYEDHWVCEWWDDGQGRWRLADPQFDKVWRAKLQIQHDITDVPRDHFLIAAVAWRQCRAGASDPDVFGISFVKLHGLWYVAGNLVRDVAALNRHEMLPWDVWGAQPKPGEELDEGQLKFFDDIAALTADPDRHFDALRAHYRSEALRTPPKVFNSLRQRLEAA